MIEADTVTRPAPAGIPGLPAILEAVAIRKTYDAGTARVDALRGVDLAVAAGEMVAIMGPPGCGKTTLLNCLSGLDSIDAGEVLIEGTALSTMSDAERTDYRARRMGELERSHARRPVDEPRGIFLVVYVAALAATLAPALRATRIRPADALRYQ